MHTEPGTLFRMTKYDVIHMTLCVIINFQTHLSLSLSLSLSFSLFLKPVFSIGKLDSLSITGTQHKTADGTSVRDYIHVVDLVDAHVRAMGAMNNGSVRIYNVGVGKGYVCESLCLIHHTSSLA